MVSNSVKPTGSNAQGNAERSSVWKHFERVETKRHPPKLSNQYGEDIVQGVVKATQTRILWSLVRVQVGPPTSRELYTNNPQF